MTLSTSNITQPLDLQKIFVNYFAGDPEIFMLVALVFFTWLAAYLRMPSTVFIMLFGIFLTSMGFIYPVMFKVGIILLGLFAAYQIARMVIS